jgi:lipopolysaccharide/colanic/teichoic acid biosynthesis glycosyltransferase
LLFDLRAPALTEYQWVAKRLFDVILTVISLPLIVPICVAIGVAIKLDSRGSIFFRQKRLGMNGALIEILKFRTMVADAEKKLQEL